MKTGPIRSQSFTHNFPEGPESHTALDTETNTEKHAAVVLKWLLARKEETDM